MSSDAKNKKLQFKSHSFLKEGHAHHRTHTDIFACMQISIENHELTHNNLYTNIRTQTAHKRIDTHKSRSGEEWKAK